MDGVVIRRPSPITCCFLFLLFGIWMWESRLELEQMEISASFDGLTFSNAFKKSRNDWSKTNMFIEEKRKGKERNGMNELNSGRAKPWNNMYSNSESLDKGGPWKSLGSSMNAISFGFVATAILISMFLIMAIFEHLFRPSSHQEETTQTESTQIHKLDTPHHPVQTSYASDFSVVMPGQHYPSFIAQPAPLPREEVVRWLSPSHPTKSNQ